MSTRGPVDSLKVGKPFNPYKVFVGSFLPNVLLRYEGLSPLDKLMWARLAQYAGDKGYCYPSYEALAAELGISRRHAIRAVKRLVEDRFIEVVEQNKGGAGRVNVYRFLFHPCLMPYETAQTVTNCHPFNGDSSVTVNGDKLSLLTVTNLVKNGDKSVTPYKGVKENQEDNQGERKARPHPGAIAQEKATAALEELTAQLGGYRDNGRRMAVQDRIALQVLNEDLGGLQLALKMARDELAEQFVLAYVRRELAAWRAGRNGNGEREIHGKSRGP